MKLLPMYPHNPADARRDEGNQKPAVADFNNQVLLNVKMKQNYLN